MSGESEEEGFVCLKKGKGCWEFPECRAFCDEAFLGKSARQICYQWPISLYEDFRELFITIRTEPFQNLKPKVLKCFIHLSEGDKTALFKRFSREETLDFLEEIAKNPSLAFHLSKEDTGKFPILHSLFKKVSGRAPSAVQKTGSGTRNFLIVLNKYHNHYAWIWINDYLVYRCNRDSACKEPLDYYCEIFEKTLSSHLEDFFDNRRFKNEYRRAIESKQCGSQSCEYGDIRDFKKICDRF